MENTNKGDNKPTYIFKLKKTYGKSFDLICYGYNDKIGYEYNFEDELGVISFSICGLKKLNREYLTGIINKRKIRLLFKTEKICCIDFLNVYGDYRDLGIGSMLIDKLIGFCKKRGIEEYFLDANPSDLSNDNSLDLNNLKKLYSTFGFKEIEKSNYEIKKQGKNNILMCITK